MRLHMWPTVKVMMPGKYFVTTINNGKYGVPFTSAEMNTYKSLQRTHYNLKSLRPRASYISYCRQVRKQQHDMTFLCGFVSTLKCLCSWDALKSHIV